MPINRKKTGAIGLFIAIIPILYKHLFTKELNGLVSWSCYILGIMLLIYSLNKKG